MPRVRSVLSLSLFSKANVGIFIVLLGAAQLAGAQAVVVDSGAINMSGVKDVTGGQHYLLQDDDLSLLQVYQTSNGLEVANSGFPTSNSSVSGTGNGVGSGLTTPSSVVIKGSTLAATDAGRMYAIGKDQSFILQTGVNPGQSAWSYLLEDLSTDASYSGVLKSAFSPTGTVHTQVIMGDFRGDALVEPLLLYQNFSIQTGYQWGMTIVSAQDTTTVGSLVQGPELYGENLNFNASPEYVAVGDFNGDGRDEIAAIMQDQQTIVFYSVNPTTYQITATGSYVLPQAFIGNDVKIVGGRFRNCGNPPCVTTADLAVVGEYETGIQGQLIVLPVQITPQSNGTFTAQATTDFGFPQLPDRNNFYVRAAPIVSWPQNNTEQLVIGQEAYNQGNWIDIGTFVPTGNNTTVLGKFDWESQTYLGGSSINLMDLAVGNFDSQDSSGNANPGIQIAIDTLQGSTSHLMVYNVTAPNPFPAPNINNSPPSADWLSDLSDYAVPTGYAQSDALTTVIVPLDYQGRSLRLGTPYVLSIATQAQPDLVLAVPPMHADWVPAGTSQAGCTGSAPCLFNVSVVPIQYPNSPEAGFATGFQFSSTSDSKYKHEASTSWGISVGENAAATFKWGDDDDGSSVKIKTAAKYTHDGNVAKTYSHYSGQSASLEITTGFSDYVYYSQKRVNVYYYPVLGQKVCPGGGNTCSSPEQQWVEFSVPDQLQYADADGSSLWWYQPVHQLGNIFSYPLDKAQMQLGFSDTINPLTLDPATCNTLSTSTGSVSNNWTSGSSTATTRGSANSFSDDVSVSLSSYGGVTDVVTGKVTYGVSISGNVSVNSLYETGTSLSSSEGVTISTPNFENDLVNCCGYSWSDYIFGLTSPNTAAQSPVDVITDPANNVIADADVTNGPLFVGFMADMLTSKPNGMNACNNLVDWWPTTYKTPDIALNHPVALNWSPNTLAVTFNEPDLSGKTSPLLQPFYEMKGFFIAKQGDESNTPQLQYAVAGDQLQLTTRVYNYSTVDAVSPVHVRIYGQYYCSDGPNSEKSCTPPGAGPTCTGGNLCGNSWLIGESVIAKGIPGFKSQASGSSYLPNWTTASVNFDTTNYATTNLIFWVVAWMEDGNGNLVAEMADHGLTAKPGTNLTSILQVPTQMHGNNVGMYSVHSPFQIAPTTAPSLTAGTPSLKSVSLSGAATTPLASYSPVAVKVQTNAVANANNINVTVYDGDPAANGQLLDVETIPSISAGAGYQLHSPFRPTTCGTHTLYASAWLNGQAAVQARQAILVSAEQATLLNNLSAATQAAKMDAHLQSLLVGLLSAATSQSSMSLQYLSDYLNKLNSAVGSGITQHAASPLQGAAQQLLGCMPLGFTLSAIPDNAYVPAGGTAQFPVAITPLGNFQGPVVLTCSGGPQNTACTFSTSTVMLNGSAQTMVTMSVATSVSTMGAGLGPLGSGPLDGRWWLSALLPFLLAGLVGRARRKAALWLCLMLAVMTAGVVGCGGPSAKAGTGSYQMTVQATSGNVTQTLPLTLVIGQ